MTILRMCELTTGVTEIPIFHIDGKINFADLLTKHHLSGVESVTIGLEWQSGMKLDV